MRIIDGTVIHREVPIARPVETSFGVMNARHAVLLSLEDEDGHRGLGESWVNFPLWAPWERVAAFERRTRRMAIRVGEVRLGGNACSRFRNGASAGLGLGVAGEFFGCAGVRLGDGCAFGFAFRLVAC